MAGHSQFKNIMHRKGAQDAKRAKVFTKLLREVTVAARAGGADAGSNPRLRNALYQARQANMPKDTLERAISRATEETGNYESLYYEGFGPGQAALLIHVLTDNRNRSASEVRGFFHKHGGRFGDVAFLFSHVGIIAYPLLTTQAALAERAIDQGATDIQEEEDACVLQCPRDLFFALRESLEAEFGPPTYASLAWVPFLPHIVADHHQQESLRKFIGSLEELEDVQEVWSNVHLPPEE